MKFPITGQRYNLVSAAFYIGKSSMKRSNAEILYICETRLSVLGISHFLLGSKNQSGEIPRCQRMFMGNDADVASNNDQFWGLLSFTFSNG